MDDFSGRNLASGNCHGSPERTRPANSGDRRAQGFASSIGSLHAPQSFMDAGVIERNAIFLDNHTQHPAQTTATLGNAPQNLIVSGLSSAFPSWVAYQASRAQEDSGSVQSGSYAYAMSDPRVQPSGLQTYPQDVSWRVVDGQREPWDLTADTVIDETSSNVYTDPTDRELFAQYTNLGDSIMLYQHMDGHSGLPNFTGQRASFESSVSEPSANEARDSRPHSSSTASDLVTSLQMDACMDLSHNQYSYDENRSLSINQPEEPWSSTNMRSGEHIHFSFVDPRVHDSIEPGTFGSTSRDSDEYGSSVPIYNEATSRATFASDVDDIMVESWATIREGGGEYAYSVDYVPVDDCPDRHGRPSTHNAVPDTLAGIGFQLRIREDTPSPMTGVEGDAYGGVQNGDTMIYMHPRSCLSVPSPRSLYSDTPSTPSQMSVTSSSVSFVLRCDEDNCYAEFTGEYRKGNLARHKRRKHKGMPGDYPCEDPHCFRGFNRSDARLKHYRRHHAHLVARPMVPRGSRGDGRARS